MNKMTGILLVMLMIVSSCSQKYASDPMDEFNELTDSTTREEMREISGTFWCNGYGDYFEPDEWDEIWCIYMSALCPRYEHELAAAEAAADSTSRVSSLVDVVLSGFVGRPIDESFEPDCYRAFYVTSLHSMEARITERPSIRRVPPSRRDKDR